MKQIIIISFLLLHFSLSAQSTVGIQAGWTISNVRALYDQSKYQLGPVGNEFVEFDPLNTSFIGFMYSHNVQGIKLSTGISMLVVGSSDIAAAPDHPWVNTYATVPLLVGYSFDISKKAPLKLTSQGGIELGYRLGNGVLGDEKWWGLFNLTVGLELHYKRFGLGLRGHWGMNDFFEYYPFHYRHTGITTYLAYTFWDSQKARQRYLERRQAKQLAP